MKQNLMVGALMFAATLMVFGMTQASAQSADNPAAVEAGKTVFEGSCAGCHGNDGEGSSRGRPLTGIAAQEADRSVHIASVTDGKGGMPAFGENLSDEQIDAAISYVRLTFVEEAAATTTEESTDDSASSDDAATSSDADTELAVTGSETPLVAIGGLTLIAGGALMVHYSRREQD